MTALRSLKLMIDGKPYDQWQEGEVSRDLKNFAGTFTFTCRDSFRSQATFLYASPIPPIFLLKPGAKAQISIGGAPMLEGYIETVSPNISADEASVTISGKDKAGDLIDCAASETAGEFKKVKLEQAAEKIAKPYGLKVRAEVDTGDIFARYGLDLAETALAALEKGARQRGLLLLSDGIGGLVITRSGAHRAPADLKLPGNVLSSSASFSHKNRHSKTIIHGQGEKSGGKRLDGTAAALGAGKTIPPEERKNGGSAARFAGAPMPKPKHGDATRREEAGVCAMGQSLDEEIKRYRPKVHLAATKGDVKTCQQEADWRSRSSRGSSEEMRYTVAGHMANGRAWKVNELVFVSDAFQSLEHDMLISGVSFRESDEGKITELTLISPEAYDNRPVKGRRKNKKGKTGALDSKAKAL